MDTLEPLPHPQSSLRETLEAQRVAACDQLEAAWQLQVARIEAQLPEGWKEHVRQVVEERFLEITAQVEEAFAGEMETRLAELRSDLRRDLGEQFNQSMRRLRNGGSEEELLANLLEAAGAFCGRAALFVVEGAGLRCAGSQDFRLDAAGQLTGTVVPLASAPALFSAVEALDTAVAAQTAAELSEPLAVFFGEAPDRQAGLLPIVCRGKTVGVLCAAGLDAGEVQIRGLEILTTLAGLVIEAGVMSGSPSPAAPEPAWSQLPPQERDLHLRAQRFARVQAAEMRLYKTNAVRVGRAEKDIYAMLRSDIDGAREAFRLNFVVPCASMTDYLHAELVRTLANDDAALLGPEYPGPLV